MQNILKIPVNLINSFKQVENGPAENPDEADEIPVIESIPKFLDWFDKTEETHEDKSDDVYHKFYMHLEDQTSQCDELLNEVNCH